MAQLLSFTLSVMVSEIRTLRRGAHESQVLAGGLGRPPASMVSPIILTGNTFLS